MANSAQLSTPLRNPGDLEGGSWGDVLPHGEDQLLERRGFRHMVGCQDRQLRTQRAFLGQDSGRNVLWPEAEVSRGAPSTSL